MDDQTKCEIYTKLLNSLDKNGKLKEEISEDTFNNQIKLIKADLLSKENSDQKTALQILKILIKNNVQDVQQNVITLLKENNLNQALKISIFDSIRNYIKDLLQSHNVTSLASLYVHWKNFDLQKFYELLESASRQETQDASQSEPINFANLIVEYFLPIMSSPEQVHLKQPLIEVATKIAEMYPISNLTTEQYQEVLKKIPGLLTDIVNLKKSNENVWREPLHFFIEYLDKKLYSPEVQEMFSNSSLNWDLVRIDLESNINIELIEYISENNLISTAILFRSWKNLDPQKFTAALKEICQNNDYIACCKTFFFDKLIPVIMAPKNMSDPMKVYYIDIALKFAASLPLSKLSPDEYNKFIGSVNDYIKHISDLRDMQFEHWHKLWIFLVRLFGKKLHHSMTLINRLLRVVEHAFRNPSYEQRIRGYDCWKELIDNVSLDSHHISSEKQIRLLLTPLRAKFSKQEAVIIKRFDVFIYLIEKLQDKAVLVLKEFLEFCFGVVGEDTDPNKSGQGKGLPELWVRSAKVLLAMLGHSHESNEHCLETNTEISLRGPVLNSNNISNHYCHTINSVSESCILLKDVELNLEKNTVLKCFWTSLLNIVLDDNVTKKDKCIETLGKVLEKLLKNSDPYCNSIAVEIFRSTIKVDMPKVLPFVLDSLERFTRLIFLVPLNNESCLDVEKFQAMVCSVESSDTKSKIIQNLFHCFAEYQTLESNTNFVAQFWIFLVNELDDYAQNKCLNFLIWPALHFHHVTEPAKGALIYEHYKQIVTKFVEKSDELHLGLFKSFEKIIKNNPLLIKNVLALVTMFTPKTEHKEITNVTLGILDLMMVFPATDDSSSQRKNIELYLKKFYELNVTNINDRDTIQKLCTCLQHILKFKHYDILTVVVPSLQSLPDNIKWVHVKFLPLDFLMDLFEKETDVSVAEKIHNLIDVVRNVKNPEIKKEITSFMPRGGRSAKIAKLVKEIPRSPNKRSDSPTTLRLFGKDVETHSPLSVKGSQLKDLKNSPKANMKDTPNKTQTSTPTRNSKLRIDDETNSKFVLIETEVKLDKSKLTEHQKEALKKRREDIPALYQDLSQSMTQSLDGSIRSKIEDIIGVQPPCDNYSKVIVQPLNYEPITDYGNSENESLNNFEEQSVKTKETSVAVSDAVESGISPVDSLEIESENKELNKVELKKASVEAELKKLSMSIVGAEEFLASSSKRKRRSKKLDLEENKETPNTKRKSKGSHAITPKVEKSNLTITDSEVINIENDELENSKIIDVKNRGGKVKRQNISTESPSEQISTTVSEHLTVTIKTGNSAEECSKAEEENKKKRDSLAIKKDTSEALVNKDKDIELNTSIDHTKISTKTSSFEESVKKSDHNLKKFSADAEMNIKGDKRKQKLAEEQINQPMESKPIVAVAEGSEVPALIGLNKLESAIIETLDLKVVNSTHLSNKDTPKISKMRGRPTGGKRTPSNKPSSVESSPKDQSPIRSKLELRPPTEIDNKANQAIKSVPVNEIIKVNSGIAAEVSKIPAVIGLNKPETAVITTEEVNEVKKEDQLANKNTSRFKKKRGWPLGVKRSPTNKKSSGSLETIDKELQDDYTASAADKGETGSNTDEQKRKRGSKNMGKRFSKVDCKLFEATNQIEPTDVDVYQFDTEQEMVIIPLRSPNKDSKLSVSTKDLSDLPVEDNLLISETSKEEETPTGRKSKRKSIPTEKFTQSELFKSSELTKPTHGSLKSKKLITTTLKESHSNKKVRKMINLPDEKLTQSELFKHTEEENDASHSFTISDNPSVPKSSEMPLDPSESKKVSQAVDKEALCVSGAKHDTLENEVFVDKSKSITKNENVKLNENIFRRSTKRKRLSSDDDDDIIESSQDSSIPNASVPKLRLSVGKRTSVDSPSVGEIKKNIEREKIIEDIFDNKSLDQVDIDKDNIVVTPEEKKRKRGRPPKSPAKQTVTSEVKRRRGRPLKNPLKQDTFVADDNVSKEYIPTDVQEHESSGTARANDETIIEVTAKAEEETHLNNGGESADQAQCSDIVKIKISTGEKQSKKTTTLHMLEAIDRVASGIVSNTEKSKGSNRKNPLKSELNQDLMREVKRQVFPQEVQVDLDITTQNVKQRTQSQDTQTQETESIDMNDEIQLQLNLPQKPMLDDIDKGIARMDTASLSLGISEVEELKGFDLSSGDETRVEANRTVVENKTIIGDVAESENVIDSSEETNLDYSNIDVVIAQAPMIEHEIIPIDEIITNYMPESIVNYIEKTIPLTEPSEISEIAETESIITHVTIVDRSPVKEEITIKCMGTPEPLESSLPSSPVTGDTPNRTSELLNCTSDISPIGSKSSSDDEFVEKRKLIPVALKFEESVDQEGNKEKSPEKADDAPRKIDEASPDKAEKNVDEATSSSPPKDEAKTDRDLKNIAERSSRFFDMVKCGSPSTIRLFNKRKSGLNMSPSASRIKKLMSNVKAPSQSEISDNVTEEDILTFTREVPSPLAVPRSSILKRKHSDTTDDGLSPCPKRKRVNFSDPCTTSKKVFIKEDNPTSQCLFSANSDDDLDKQLLEVLAANNIIDTPTPQTESDTIETEESLQIKNPVLLRDDVPIYPDLVDCEESVSVISRKLTSPMFVNALLNKLNSTNIKTIGDLAQQSEIGIARLPFKTPMVANVYKALDNYYHKNYKNRVNKEKHETRRNGEPDAVNEGTRPLPCLEVALLKMDVKDELLKIMERAKSQNMSTDTLCSLLFSTADGQEVLKYVKTQFNLETKDIVDEKDFPIILKHITETVGLPRIFEILTESLESCEEESVYFDCMIKHSIEKKPLSSLIDKRSVEELQAAIWENVECGMYTKKQLLDTCFLPFVNSLDLTPVLNKMSVVQIEEIVFTRLKTEDYPDFINKILKKCSDHAKLKEALSNHFSVNELTSNIIKRGSPQEVISSFTYMFLSTEKSHDDLVQMFRLVSDNLINVLPPSKLMQLSIEFQKKIPIKD